MTQVKMSCKWIYDNLINIKRWIYACCKFAIGQNYNPWITYYPGRTEHQHKLNIIHDVILKFKNSTQLLHFCRTPWNSRCSPFTTLRTRTWAAFVWQKLFDRLPLRWIQPDSKELDKKLTWQLPFSPMLESTD